MAESDWLPPVNAYKAAQPRERARHAHADSSYPLPRKRKKNRQTEADLIEKLIRKLNMCALKANSRIAQTDYLIIHPTHKNPTKQTVRLLVQGSSEPLRLLGPSTLNSAPLRFPLTPFPLPTSKQKYRL